MLTLQDARRYAAEIVSQVGPDFRYMTIRTAAHAQCLYIPLKEARAQGIYREEQIEDDPREKTGCLVGRILDAAGETAHRSHHVEITDNVDDLYRKFPGLFDNIVGGYLTTLQISQDDGKTWAESVADGENWLRTEPVAASSIS